MEKHALQQSACSLGNGERHLQGLIEKFLKLKAQSSRGGIMDWWDGEDIQLAASNNIDKIAIAKYQLQGHVKH